VIVVAQLRALQRILRSAERVCNDFPQVEKQMQRDIQKAKRSVQVAGAYATAYLAQKPPPSG
jgi:hypothetical protein